MENTYLKNVVLLGYYTMISNSVTHLQSYTNSAIARNCMPWCRYRWKLRASADVAANRFGKSIHISMISNSVTHLRSYTNSAIADIAGNSAPILLVTPRNHRRRRAERRRLCIQRRRYRRYRAPISSHRMTYARSPTSLLQTQTSPHRAPISSHRMTTVSWCFTMF